MPEVILEVPSTEEILEVPSTEEIAQHYSAMGDSANLINTGKPADMSAEDWADMKSRNQEHLVLMAAKDFWTNEDFTDVNKAINA
jgi:hypothetical protein